MMPDTDDKKIRAELEDIFGKIDGIIRRIETEDPGKAPSEDDQKNKASDASTKPGDPP
jgi:hypothetical protein